LQMGKRKLQKIFSFMENSLHVTILSAQDGQRRRT